MKVSLENEGKTSSGDCQMRWSIVIDSFNDINLEGRDSSVMAGLILQLQ